MNKKKGFFYLVLVRVTCPLAAYISCDMKLYKNLKRRFRAGNVLSRMLRTVFEKKIVRPLLGVQLFAGVLMFGQLSFLPEQSGELAYPGIGISDVVIQAGVEPVMQTASAAMQNPAAKYLSISTHFRGGHAGLDLRAPLGSAIYPTADGVVKTIMHSTHGYGRRVIIQHANGYESLYAHMGKIGVEEGQKVTKQTKLGEVGLTGYTTGPHIHFELYRDGVPINPEYFLDLKTLPIEQ